MDWRITVAAVGAMPVSLEDARLHLRVDHFDEDELISDLIAAAVGHVEKLTGLYLSGQTVTLWSDDGFASDTLRLEAAPVQAVTVTYKDAQGATQTLSPGAYTARLDGLSPEISSSAWPVASEVTVTATCGYATLPGPLKHAIRIMLAHFYQAREGGQAMPDIEALVCNYRRAFFGAPA